jgi:hypothetical protein
MQHRGTLRSTPLTVVGLLMLAALAASVVGLIVDPRIITGAPAWLKPAKFAISIAIYVFTLEWIFTQVPAWTRTRRVVSWVSAIVFVLELAIIDLQAWRGTTSHFNVGTPLDAVLFATMGAAIVVQTVTSVAVAVALWRERFTDRAIGWALRLGVTMTIVGAFSGGLMTRPTEAQLTAARAGARITIAGAHTVGAPDGGRGIPGTGWSRDHGDLRVPHFVGLHAMQVLPLVALLLRRTRLAERTRVRVTVTTGLSYAGLFLLLMWQAFAGESVVTPGAVTMSALAAWAIVTGAVVARAATIDRALARVAVGVDR